MGNLYFSGYALWNYFMTPHYLLWPGFETRELDSHTEAGQTWRVLEVIYPDDFPTHCKVQKYYFDDKYRLRRLDYSVDIIKGGRAAHYLFDDTEVDGLVFPMLRRALSLVEGQQPTGPSLVLLNFQSIVVRDEAQYGKL